MNILILGSGGREHALAWKLSQSPKIKELFIAPGNAGTAQAGKNIALDPMNFDEVKKTVLDNNIGMVIVGPEAPLVEGIHDYFLIDPDLRSIPVIGPDKSAARLEGSKDFAKGFLTRHKIPTAAYKSFDVTNVDEVPLFLKTLKPPYVIKADGLAAGKGVVILNDFSEAVAEARSMLGGKFGSAGKKVVIEQYLKGIELSVFIITDGRSYKLLPEAKDYKRIGEGDEGLNTGGMGAVSPVPFAGMEFMDKVKTRIIEPTLRGLQEEGITYKGFIFFGLMNSGGNPYVIEYNARLGDPESEVIIPRIKSDLYDLLEGVADSTLGNKGIIIDNRVAATVMLVSGGYPGDYQKGKIIKGLDKAGDSIIFHAGTSTRGNEVVTAGGRVLSVTSLGKEIIDALNQCYRTASVIEFDDVYYRKDIGFDLKYK